MLEERTTRNLDQQIQVGKSKVLKNDACCLKLVFTKDNLMIGGFTYNIIKIWDITSGTCLKTLHHIDNVLSVCATDNIIISASRVNGISIWNINTGICLKTLEGYTD